MSEHGTNLSTKDPSDRYWRGMFIVTTTSDATILTGNFIYRLKRLCYFKIDHDLSLSFPYIYQSSHSTLYVKKMAQNVRYHTFGTCYFTMLSVARLYGVE